MSSNVSKQNACNVTSLSKLVKPLTVSKSVSSTILSKSNICNTSIVRQHVTPLKAHQQISKKRCLEKYYACDRTCQVSAL